MRPTLALAAFVLVQSCAAPAPPRPGSPQDLATCAARGGTIAPRGGLGPVPVCALLYPDAGRSCADSSQCAGRCLVSYQSQLRRPGRVAGQCQREQGVVFGCYAEVQGGRAGLVICTD